MVTNNFKDAKRRYLRVFAPVMIFYCAFCFVGPLLLATMDNPPRPVFTVVAIVTGAPIAIIFWLIGRHLKETDEYTRKIQIDTLLVGGGVTFSAAVIWGFLELYKVVPRLEHFPAMMMVGPIFFGAWGLAYAVQVLQRR